MTGKSSRSRSNRERLSSAGSNLKKDICEVHPGADSVKRPRQDSRIRIVYVTDSKVKDVDSFIRVEPRI